MKRLLILSSILLTICSKAQTVTPTVISSNGGSAVLTGGSIDWTIGEVVSDTYTNGTNITTNGFHQPLINLSTLINEHSSSAEIVTYPNPVSKSLQLKISDIKCTTFAVQLHDAAGKQIFNRTIVFSSVNSTAEIDLSELSEGAYLAQVTALECNIIKTIKILKSN